MNNWDTGYKWRMSRGLFWPTNRPPIPWRAIVRTTLLIAGLLGAYGLVDANDRAAEARLEAEQASADLLACLNGNLYLITETDGTKCQLAETVPLTTKGPTQ
jgi:hypothetical protein